MALFAYNCLGKKYYCNSISAGDINWLPPVRRGATFAAVKNPVDIVIPLQIHSDSSLCGFFRAFVELARAFQALTWTVAHIHGNCGRSL